MARFKIISKDGSSVKYEGKLRYIGSYLKPSYVEFSEIASPTPINWEVGDYVDYSRTGMRYRLYSVPQVVKNARVGSHGNAFSYTNVQFFAATKELEIALFRDLVSGDNNIHFSTSPDVATFEDVAGIARRIQACMDDLYPGKWVIKVADFDAEADAVVVEKITTAKDFALGGGTCLDALSKIYELWQDIGWIHSYDSTSGKDIITIGYANKRIDANTTDAFLYGKGNGLTAIKKSQANKDEFATRLYVYGSERNLPARYYNDKDILNAESVDIRNLMLPMDVWGRTDGKPDARKAYIENEEAVAKIGIIPRVHYFDSEEAGADIYPSIEGMTVGMLRKVLSDMGDTAYSPSVNIYPNDEDRVDEIGDVLDLPADEGKISEVVQAHSIIIPPYVKSTNTSIVDTKDLVSDHILYEGLLESSFDMGEILFKPSVVCTVADANFSSVYATVTLDDSLGASTTSPSATAIINAEYDEGLQSWVIRLSDISVKFDNKKYIGGFYVYYYITITAVKYNPNSADFVDVKIEKGSAEIEVRQILDKTFRLRLKQIGFDLNNQADLGKGKTISMKTGMCAGRNFIISSAKYVPGTDSWDITCKRQQDNSLGLVFPNSHFEIKKQDRFILLDIAMPESYIRAAMERLLLEGNKLLSRVSKVQSHYEPSIDAKLMAESGKHLREGMFMEIADEDIVDNITEYLLIDTLSIYEDENAIPTYKVTLRERRKVTYKGTPSATTITDREPLSESEVNLSEYAKIAYVDRKDKEFSGILAKVLDWFTLEDDTLMTKYNLASKRQVSSMGVGEQGEGGGGAGGSATLEGLLDVDINFDSLTPKEKKHQGLQYDSSRQIWRNKTLMVHHVQSEPQKIWKIAHNLGKFPNVKIVDSAKQLCMADIYYDDENNITIEFGAAQSGNAYLD